MYGYMSGVSGIVEFLLFVVLGCLYYVNSCVRGFCVGLCFLDVVLRVGGSKCFCETLTLWVLVVVVFVFILFFVYACCF